MAETSGARLAEQTSGGTIMRQNGKLYIEVVLIAAILIAAWLRFGYLVFGDG